MPGLFCIKRLESYVVKKNSIQTSVVIVNYHADDFVRQIQKQLANDPTVECIVIDNSHGKSGYGAGCNAGAQKARGETVLFVNPDINISPETVHTLSTYLMDHPQIGLIGPQILDETGKIQITCSTIPTPLEAVIIYSWIGKLPWFQTWYSRYRLQGFNHQTSRPVPAISGSCFMMRREEFLEIGGCDENIFLYFEEFDIAKRVHDQLEKEVYFLTSCAIIHYGQESTKQLPTVSQHFQRSRRYWLQKHYGIMGLLADSWLRIWERIA